MRRVQNLVDRKDKFQQSRRKHWMVYTHNHMSALDRLVTMSWNWHKRYPCSSLVRRVTERRIMSVE
jgi:hypothetical protein